MIDHDLIVSITMWAAIEGHEGVVKLLLERENVDPNLPDENNRTPLLWAALRRDELVVKLFSERRYFVPNQQAPSVYLRIAIDLCFLITALFFLSHFLTIA